MADKHSSPTAMPPVITLDRPSGSQTLSSLPPATTSLQSSMSITASQPSDSNNNTVAPIASPMGPMAMEQKKPLDISSLMSPPEPTPYDSFSQGQPSSSSSSVANPTTKMPRPQAPMSPPVSPFHRAESNATVAVSAMSSAPTASATPPTPNSGPVKDPILYPAQDITPSPPQRPLFEPLDNDQRRKDDRDIDQHLASRPPSLFRAASPPERRDYELALYFKAQVMKNYQRNPLGWLKKERQLLKDDLKLAGAKRNKPKFPPLLPARTGGTAPAVQSVKMPRAPRPDKVTKSHASPRPIRTNPAPPRAVRVSATPEPRRIVAPNREDKDFASLPDYCPPLSSLPDKANSLKVDWKGAPIDLTGDPNAKHLHPDEISLAANLRLDCATYLTSKRRIFIRRLECARVGKEFRKTDAQQACKIDVNKASKLWTAFEKVGWLDIQWMKQYVLRS